MTSSNWNRAYRTRETGAWGWILAYGLLLVLIGGVAIAQPFITSFAAGLFLGCVLLGTGIVNLIAGVTDHGWHNRWLDILSGLLSVVAGAIMLWNPMVGALTLVWTLGIWFIVSGILELSFGFGQGYQRGWLLLAGLADVLLGLYLLFARPIEALVILAVFLGISFILRGVSLSILAFGMRALSRR